MIRIYAALGAMLVFLSCSGEGESPSPERVQETSNRRMSDVQDVLLITIDTLRADALGFAGNQASETPNLDRLAAAGRVFPNSHAHNVVTLPSHTNILTGLYPPRHGVRENSGFALRDDVPTLATELSAQGWATGAFVAAYPLDSRYGLDRGFDVYDDEYQQTGSSTEFRFAERRGDEVVERALAWWNSEEGRSRFLWIHLYDPHAPYDPPEPYASRFAERPYLGEVAATDAFLGPILDAANEQTLIVVTSDHGEALGDHGEITHGLFAYEATLRVPLVVRGPGVEPGEDPRSAGHVDIAPTILEAVGVASPGDLDGSSLLAPAPAEREIYFEALSTYYNRGWAPLRGQIVDGTKAIALPIFELYDLEGDPAEQNNLAEADRERLRKLVRSLPEETWPPEQRQVSSEEAEALRGLGYLASSGERRTSFTEADDPKNLIELDRTMHVLIDAYSRGRLEEALVLARKMIDARPEMALGYEHLGMVLRDLGRSEEAAQALDQAARSGVTSTPLLRQLGLTLAEIGRPREAVSVLQSLSADDPETLDALGLALSEAGAQQQAIEVLQRSLTLNEGGVRARETLGVAYLRLEQPARAQQYFEEALQRNENLPNSWNSLGVAHAWQRNPQAAVEAWQRALALEPNLWDALYNLGLTAAQIGAVDLARETLQRYVDEAPPEFAADVAKARQYLRQLNR